MNRICQGQRAKGRRHNQKTGKVGTMSQIGGGRVKNKTKMSQKPKGGLDFSKMSQFQIGTFENHLFW